MLSGRLRAAGEAPSRGEIVDEVARLAGGVVVEQILSGELDAPVDYVQDHDEWVVVLTGEGVVETEGAQHRLTPGDWLLLPAYVPHRLVHTAVGTVWLAVHAPPSP